MNTPNNTININHHHTYILFPTKSHHIHFTLTMDSLITMNKTEEPSPYYGDYYYYDEST